MLVHGGPTAHVTPPSTSRFSCSRAAASPSSISTTAAAPATGGNTGDRLRGRWGDVDVEDSVAAARYLGERGDADPGRVQITGGSAGGYTTLMALAVRRGVRSGVSYYGVADLVTFPRRRTSSSPITTSTSSGPGPKLSTCIANAPRYARRLDLGSALLLQGLDDKVVPPPRPR